jgi:NiFe hydrogenase small subunit HydA
MAAENAFKVGQYVLVIEGGVPTAFQGHACLAWTLNGVEYTFKDVVTRYASKAAAILCIGNCAAYGGIAAASPNPAGVVSVSALTGKATINIPGCPAHPDWFIWVVAQYLAGARITLDGYGRPKALFERTVHERCPRKEREREGLTFGVDGYCLEELGCKGPETKAPCPVGKWNGGVNWCIDANAPCIGCTEPTFPLKGLMGDDD